MKLSDLLNQKKCFKLICGAGNEDYKMIERLVAVYAKAGVHYFDLSPNKESVLAAKKGIERVVPKNKRKEYFYCVSVGVNGDPHAMKARINLEKCRACGACSVVCLQNAIQNAVDSKGIKKYLVIDSKCIGCNACAKVCKFGAIDFQYKERNLRKILPPLIDLGVSSIELHAITEDDDESYSIWRTMNKAFPGILSVCLDRSHLSDKQLINRIKLFIKDRKDFTTIVQADGSPMSGSNDNNNTTLQTIATADIVQKARLPVWVLMSGGTNSKTSKLAKLFEVQANGVSLGSFARKIIKEELNNEDFFENKTIFNSAYKKAKELVNETLKYLV
ncbi:MAG: 4Fe-4S dicluster domain-containing protein [Microgenomates group bacterium]